MSSVFNSLKSTVPPIFRNIATYVSTNRDLSAKPLHGVVGSLIAKGLSEGVPTLISHIAKRNKSRIAEPKLPDDPKYKEILQSIMSSQTSGLTTPVTNIIGSGARGAANVKLRGAGVKLGHFR